VKTCIWEGLIRGVPHQLLVEEGEELVVSLEKSSSGPLFEVFAGLKTFVSAHPFLTGYLTGMGLDALKKYNEAKKTAIKLYAKDVTERSKYTAMVKEMEKNGYKIVKQGYIHGTGYYWELNR
jgi:hypothetical protein